MSSKHIDDLETDESWPLLARFREYGGSHAHYLAVSLIAGLIGQTIGTSAPTIIGIAIDAMFNAKPYNLPVVPDAWVPTDPYGQLWFTGGLLLSIYAVSLPIGFSGQYFRGVFSQHLQYNLKMDAYETIQELELAFFDQQQTGEVMSILNNDVDQLDTFFHYVLASLVVNLTAVFAMVVYMSLLNWQLTIVAFVLTPVFTWAGYWFGSRIQRAYGDVREAVGKMNARFEDNVSGMGVIKANTTEPFESARVAESSAETFRTNWAAIKLRQKFYPVLNILSNGTYLLTVLIGGYWVIRGLPDPFIGSMSAGELIPFLFYTQQMSGKLFTVSGHVERYSAAKASAKRIARIQRTDLTIDEKPDAHVLENVDGHVGGKDVTFGYGEEPVLEDVSFEAEPGETVGLVGSTGAGKSTLTKLLMRFYDVDDGEILVDGHDVRDVTIRSLRESIGYVAQEPYLFSGTVRENVAYGAADVGDDDVREAAEAARAHEFITQLEEGYDTEVGQRGVKLSGGQRQRIAIARAVVRDPEILIFDEATSHVDNETEVLIQHSLDRITEDRTTFVVAHRLSTVRNADTILVLDDGEVVERGTHEELIEADGQYADLWAVQVGQVAAGADSSTARSPGG